MWADDGRFSISSNETKCDIMPPEPEKVTVWVNVYPSYTVKLYDHKTREDADRNASGHRIACVPLTYFKGEGLK